MISDFNTIKHFYFLGIGGIGMSALARYFHVKGKNVYGYDKTPTPLTKELSNEGINVHYEDSTSALPGFLNDSNLNSETIIVFTPAIPKDSIQFNYLTGKGYRMWKRSEILGWITSEAATIAVAGTHGKTTTSTMIAHILRYNGVNCTAFLGGISKNYNTNLLLPAKNNDKEVMVVEADEYDRSFLTLNPDLAAITSLDADHLDIYGDHQTMIDTYTEFAGKVKDSGKLFIKYGLKLSEKTSNTVTYGIGTSADYNAINIRIENGNYVFDIRHNNVDEKDILLTWPGRHNVENATVAFAICKQYGLPVVGIRKALETFQGVKRRFDYQIRTDQIIFIDDYAHHPEELNAAISSVRELYPGKSILGIFQPHLYTRTRDFADGFGQSLSNLDELILLDIYPARELPIQGVNSEMILEKINIKNKQICSKKELNSAVTKSSASIILTLGAGDIDQLIEPLKILLENKYKLQKA